MQQNQQIHGFIATRIRPIPELEAQLIEMTHEYSHAKLAWVQRKEQNKTFSIAFRTLPADSTGVFHILEHSVLNGSEKFPLREPFAELLKSSVNTFLNALTFPDKTMYPVASRNNQDFINLIRVYLDGVFHPAALHDQRIFEQEGWHYEFDENGDAVYQGIVLNEMKGATSDVDDIAAEKLTELLFPNTPYRFNSGGDPAVIPTLTHEQFCAAHQKYYHPSNAYIFLDGDIDIDTVLRLLDQELCFIPPRNDIEKIPMQQPTSGKAAAEYELGADEDAKNKDRLCTGKLFAAYEECEKIAAAQILCNVLAETNESPLKKAIIDNNLAEDVSLEVIDDAVQCAFCVDYINTSKTLFDTLRKTTASVIRKQLETGLDKEEIRAQLKHLQFTAMNPEEPCGIGMAIAIMRSWLYDGDPLLYLNRKALFESLEKKIDTDYFNDLLKELFSGEWCEVELYPSKTRGDELRKEEKLRLAEATADWNEEKRAEIQKKAEALKIWQSTPDSPEALATLPVLTLDDLRQEPKYIDTQTEERDGITFLRHHSGKQGVVHINLYFKVPDLQKDDYTKLSVILRLIGKLPTKKHDVLTLRRLLKIHVGHYSITTVSSTSKNGCVPMIVIKLGVLESETEAALDLLREMLFETEYHYPEKVKPLLLQRIDDLRQLFINYGMSYAKKWAGAHFFPESLISEYVSGVTTYQYLKKLSDNMEEEFPILLNWAKNTIGNLLGTNRLTCGITGSDSFIMPDLTAWLPKGTIPSCQYFTETSKAPLMQGISIPSQVSCAATIADTRKLLPEYNGHMYVLKQILSFEYLWNEIRVKGGAYGANFISTRKGEIGGWTFRDPSPSTSLSIIANSADFLRSMLQDKPNIERFIIGTLSIFDPELSIMGQGETADMDYFNGITNEILLKLRKEVMNTTINDLLSLCEMLDTCLKEQAAACVTGPENVLTAIPNIVIEHL